MKVEARVQPAHLNMVLLAALQQGPLHGYGIMTALRQRSDGRINLSDGSVYPRLHRLEHLGFVGSSWSMVDGQGLRVYQLTPAGWHQLRIDRRAWEDYAALISGLLGTEESPAPPGAPQAQQ